MCRIDLVDVLASVNEPKHKMAERICYIKMQSTIFLSMVLWCFMMSHDMIMRRFTNRNCSQTTAVSGATHPTQLCCIQSKEYSKPPNALKKLTRSLYSISITKEVCGNKKENGKPIERQCV